MTPDFVLGLVSSTSSAPEPFPLTHALLALAAIITYTLEGTV